MLRRDEVVTLYNKSEIDGTPAMAELNREMIPILAELMTLRTKNHDHPATKQLFNWLVDPQRTGDEFFYVIGPLKRHVLQIMRSNFMAYMFKGLSRYCPYLGKEAAEALAVKCPILEDFWEKAAWILVIEFTEYDINKYRAASDQLSAWIIKVIGNPELCPNPYLRFELMILLYKTVVINDHNWVQAIESVFSVCSSLDIDYLLASKHDYLKHITEALKMVVDDRYMLEFDNNLTTKLLNVKSSRLYSIVHDVAHHYAVNPNKYVQPMELHSLTALLKFMARYVQLKYKSYHNEIIKWQSLLSFTLETHHLLLLLVTNLSKSCQTPQLVDLTSCVMDTIEKVIPGNAVTPNIKALNFQERLSNIQRILLDEFEIAITQQLMMDLFGLNWDRHLQPHFRYVAHA